MQKTIKADGKEFVKRGDQLIEKAYPGKGSKNRSNTQAFRDGHDNINWGEKKK